MDFFSYKTVLHLKERYEVRHQVAPLGSDSNCKMTVVVHVAIKHIPHGDVEYTQHEEDGRIPLEVVLMLRRIMQQLVDAFVEIHSRGVLHRDVHAKNVLMELGSTVP
ncbi:uncharacterized protein V6R79_000481 [Siganus canaliculatus]